MGLPLYKAPVESDIKDKPAVKTDARARSSIRRRRPYDPLRGSHDSVRHVFAAASAASSAYQNPRRPWYLGPRSGSNEPDNSAPATHSSTRNGSNDNGSDNAAGAGPGASHRFERARDVLREVMAGRMNLGSEGVAAVLGEHPDEHPDLELRPFRNPSSRGRGDNDLISHRSTLRLSSQAARLEALREVQEDLGIRRSRAHFRNPHDPTGSPPDALRRARRAARSRRGRSSPDELSFGGLGDRTRSLSPESDGVWHTLLTTMTEDPQPPSAGSSFASASASTAASQSAAAAGSSRTSLTEPDAAVDSDEPPCESGCENSDTEGDDDDETERNALMRFTGARRSYADVVSETLSAGGNTHGGTNEDPLQVLGGIGGMQRIVRNLARREDIPDEWWAEAGLSRTLSREGSS